MVMSLLSWSYARSEKTINLILLLMVLGLLGKMPLTWILMPLVFLNFNQLILKYKSYWVKIVWAIPFFIVLFGNLSFVNKIVMFAWCSVITFSQIAMDIFDLHVQSQNREALNAGQRNALLNRMLENANQEVKLQAEQVALEERNRLSHEIHDQLGHSLTGGLMQMEAARSVLNNNPQQAAQLLNQAIEINREGIEEIRRTLKKSAPSQAHMSWEEVKDLLRQFEQRYQIQTELHFTGDLGKITPIQWHVLVQNLQESLTNTVKYAEASKVTVALNVFNQFINFSVKNNGRSGSNIHKSLGLSGMEQRTVAQNGHIVINGETGFEVITIIPIENHDISHG